MGGGGADSFVFNAITETAVGALRDVIYGFQRGVDEIDLAGINEESFSFIGTSAFSGGGGMEARYRGEPVALTVTEYRLVEALARRAGMVRSRGQLIASIRDDDSVVAERLIDTYVRSLRRKFERADPAFDRIETRVGAGYRWRDDA